MKKNCESEFFIIFTFWVEGAYFDCGTLKIVGRRNNIDNWANFKKRGDLVQFNQFFKHVL